MPSFSTSKSGDIEDTPSETGTAMSELSRASSTTRRSIFHKRNPLHKVQKMLGRKSSSSLSMSAVAKISESPTPSEGPTEEATPPSTEPTSRMDPEEEAPWIGPGNKTVLRENMVFTLKATITVPEVGGLRTERIVRVTSTGLEALDVYPMELYW